MIRKNFKKNYLKISKKKMENQISSILIVLHYSDYLDVIFDFDEADVVECDPTTSDAVGVTHRKAGLIYIAASPKIPLNEILCTVAHEFTHMAMEIIYSNNSNPFLKIAKMKLNSKK